MPANTSISTSRHTMHREIDMTEGNAGLDSQFLLMCRFALQSSTPLSVATHMVSAFLLKTHNTILKLQITTSSSYCSCRSVVSKFITGKTLYLNKIYKILNRSRALAMTSWSRYCIPGRSLQRKRVDLVRNVSCHFALVATCYLFSLWEVRGRADNFCLHLNRK
jgi:hypothetical protein